MSDVDTLTRLLHRLVDGGATVVVADHHLNLIATADHIIDLGPDAGPAGGHITYQGPAADLPTTDTHTGRALAARLDM